MDYITMFNPSHPLAIAQPPNPYDPKSNTPGPVYLRQHRTIELIELIEVPAPPPRQQPSTITSSEASSSSSSSSYSDSYDSSEFDSDQDEDAGSSYCSSDEEDMAQRDMPFYDDTYRTRLGRVLAWRDSFINNHSSQHSPASTHSSSHASLSLQKRKVDQQIDDEEKSLSSKRSRSIPPPDHRNKPWSHRRLSAHSCSACDTSFATRQSLRQHAHDLQPTDPCRVAVEYGFES